jgi:OOP family OmpA-OmpF porin
MNSKMRIALAAIVASGMPLVASAGDVYVGAGIGEATYGSTKFVDCVGSTNCSGGTFSDNHFAYNLFVGYSFTDAVAVELGYQDWGTLKDDAFGLTGVELKPKMWTVMAVGTAPLAENFSVFGKVGIAFTSIDGAEGSGVTRTSGTQNAQDLALGGGVEWNLGKFGAVRVETLWVNAEDSDKAMTYGASYLYRFKL